ncbi:MAG: hypothetical protein L3K07_03840 [Thermoplasmata archaeon]|nr:hypothetical protein [Thermoplasmata archaeon]
MRPDGRDEEATTGEDFAHLPSAKILTELIEATTSEGWCRWDSYDSELPHPCLGTLWSFAKIAAAAQCRDQEDPPRPASEFLGDVHTLDGEFGEPLERRWLVTSYEAARRFDAVRNYLYQSGLLSLREAERSAPVRYLHDKELKGV